MISCIFACAEGIETQSATVELTDPMSAFFLTRKDDRARAALHAWLATQSASEQTGTVNQSDLRPLMPVGQNQAA